MTEPTNERTDVTSAEAQDATPIRGLRTMAAVRWALLLAVAALAAGSWWVFVLRPAPEAHGEDRFYCPMHPQIRSAVPGECSICHMRLEPIPAGDAAPHDTPDDDILEADADPVPVMLTTQRRQLAGIATEPVRREALVEAVRWPAVVEAREGARAEVRVRTEAFVERLVVREPGTTVRAGQVVAWVYAPEVVRAAEELRSARRWTSVPGASSATSTDVHAGARQRLELLGLLSGDIDRLLEGDSVPRTFPVRAPLSGVVTRVDAVRGTFVTPDRSLLEIADLSRVRVVASVFGDELRHVHEGLSAEFVPRDGGPTHTVRLELVEPSVEGEARTTRVRFLTDASTGTLRPGQIGEVVLRAASEDAALSVPRDAVIDTGLRRYVFVARPGGLFEPRAVELGALRGERRIVVAGLDEGERVVVRGGFVLDSESRLQAALAPARPTETAHDVEGAHEHDHARPDDERTEDAR